MFKKFLKDEEGGITEYIILLGIIALSAAIIFPRFEGFQQNILDGAIDKINQALSGGSGETTPDTDFSGPSTSITTKTIYVVNLDIPTPRNDYQIKITLDESNFNYSKASSGGENLTFKDMSGNTINRYIESWNPGGKSVIWVKVPLSGTEQFTLSVSSESNTENNPKNVFDFYDDFSIYDQTVWQKSSAVDEGELYIEDGIINIDEGAISSKLGFAPTEGYYFEVKGRIKEDQAGYSGVFGGLSTNQFVSSGNKEYRSATILLMRPRNVNGQEYTAWIGSGDTSLDKDYVYSDHSTGRVIQDNKWYVASYKVLPNKVVAYLDNSLLKEFPITWSNDLNYLILGEYTGLKRVTNWETDKMEYDYILARKASAVEPVATISKDKFEY